MSRHPLRFRRHARDLFDAGGGKILVIFDADDTLWFTEPLYDDARAECRQIVESVGFDGAAWEAAQRVIDVANVATFGLSIDRFPTSCVQAYLQLAGETSSPEIKTNLYSTAQHVFDRFAPVADGVPEILEELCHVVRLVLLTKGVTWVQERRLKDARLEAVFSRVYIVEEKTSDAFATVLTEDGRDSSFAWSIGNSLASDINPALQLGLNGIWIPAYVWEHEMRETTPLPGSFFKVRNLSEARDVILSRI